MGGTASTARHYVASDRRGISLQVSPLRDRICSPFRCFVQPGQDPISCYPVLYDLGLTLAATLFCRQQTNNTILQRQYTTSYTSTLHSYRHNTTIFRKHLNSLNTSPLHNGYSGPFPPRPAQVRLFRLNFTNGVHPHHHLNCIHKPKLPIRRLFTAIAQVCS